MKILLLSNKVPYPAKDGSSIAMQSMVNGLLGNNAEVSLLSINTLKHFRNDDEIKKNLPTGLDAHWVTCNTNITLFGAFSNLFSNKPFHVSRFWQKDYLDVLKQILQQNTFDVIQLEGLAMAVYLPIIRQLSQAKVSLRAHNVEYQIWERTLTNQSKPLRKAYLKLQIDRLRQFEYDTLEQIDALITITENDFETFSKVGYAKPHMTIPCGIEPSEYQNQQSELKFDIAYLASFDWEPNLQGLNWFLDEVWPLIRQQDAKLTLALAGRNMPQRLLDLAPNNVKILGEVDNMNDFISSAKINMVPLLAGSGMRIKIIENMALSRPMVSTTIGAEGIAIKDGKEILLADTPDDFATAIIHLVNDPTLQKNMGSAARKKVEEYYDNRVLGQQLIHFYQGLI